MLYCFEWLALLVASFIGIMFVLNWLIGTEENDEYDPDRYDVW